MFLAWLQTLRPWMTAPAFDAYQQLFLSHTISGFMPADFLANMFPDLRLGATADFNHFWFYSFLAFLPAKLAGLFGLSLQPHTAFLVLHYVLVSFSAMVAYRLYGRPGLIAFTLMTLCSPMLWFFDKVHTELFTYCFTMLGVMFMFSRRHLAAALCIALASTQNPSFALIAFFPFAYRFVMLRAQAFTLWEVCMAVATAFAVLAHPVYYFLRFGVLTPQLLAGGASLGLNLSTFYIWIFDPDLGLLPNWPLGVYFSLLALVYLKVARSGQKRLDVAYLLFSFVFLLVNFFAHASTTNLNSGATPGLARYSLWYLPLWFPVVLHVLRNLSLRSKLSWLVAGGAVVLAVASIITYNPKQPESYSNPTPFSNLIQSKLPGLYTPPAEVFIERFSGYGETIYQYKLLGVLGPDCRKLLLHPGDGDMVTIPAHCTVEPEKLQAFAKTKAGTSGAEHFVRLTDDEYGSMLLKVKPGAYSVGVSGTGNFALYSGWYAVEQWGVWSKKNKASLALPCKEHQFYEDKTSLKVVLGLQGFGQQAIEIAQRKGDVLYQGVIGTAQEIPLDVDVSRCTRGVLRIDINIAKPVSPAELGQPGDTRMLGVGLSKVTILP
ncbi:hypothetical protein [Pseudomonas putida]|uniref:Uncharacterized protein n=1 Tax=Pseudomonas putida TaxID=303 RepID=A0A6I6XUW3_PSEPU|nr:hypothetical protein [Pseudomonas putida]QHG63830.1 hypothetical protein C2H86_05070 [Pseudomonas putida]